MGRRPSLLIVMILAMCTVWVPIDFFCRDVACAKKYSPWFKSRYDHNMELLVTPENSQLLFDRIADPAQRQAAKDMIAALANKQPIPKPEGNITCAVVGNSSNLLGSGYGSKIDAHTYVFRMNSAPIKGFEHDVGIRTTHHVAHSNTSSFRDYGPQTQHYMVVADHAWQYYDAVGKSGYSDSAAIKIKLLSDQIYSGQFPRTIQPRESFLEGTHFPSNATHLSGNLAIVHPSFLFYVYDWWFDPQARKTKTFPSIGFKSLILAFHICDEVEIFGFGANHQTKRWDHYYNAGYHLSGPPSVHKWEYQEQFIEQLKKKKIVTTQQQ